jgi:hypothetical protein
LEERSVLAMRFEPRQSSQGLRPVQQSVQLFIPELLQRELLACIQELGRKYMLWGGRLETAVLAIAL